MTDAGLGMLVYHSQSEFNTFQFFHWPADFISAGLFRFAEYFPDIKDIIL